MRSLSYRFFLYILAVGGLVVAADVSRAEITTKKTFVLKDLGKVNVEVEYTGEPVSAPERVAVTFECAATGRKQVVFEQNVCRYDRLQTERNRLLLHFYQAEYYEGQVKCADPRREVIELEPFCSKK